MDALPRHQVSVLASIVLGRPSLPAVTFLGGCVPGVLPLYLL